MKQENLPDITSTKNRNQTDEGSALISFGQPCSPSAPNSSDTIPPGERRQSDSIKRYTVCRADSGKLHRVRHGILAREALDALIRMGEDRKDLRRLERQYRAAVRPAGPFGNLFFDRFWASYLRLLLISRLETRLVTRESAGNSKAPSLSLIPGHQPTLIHQDRNAQPSEATGLTEELPSELFRDLVLVQRYDRHHSREMYRALGFLLLLRRRGEAALEDWASEMRGGSQTRQGE